MGSSSMSLTSVLVGFLMCIGQVRSHGGPDSQGGCSNRTWTLEGGDLEVISWHIHYMTNSSDFPRFTEAFQRRFEQFLPPSGPRCPFGPNYASATYPHICMSSSVCMQSAANSCAFSHAAMYIYIPTEHVKEAWEFAQRIQGHVDLMLHANTGCQHDDHEIRAKWVRANGSAVASEFPDDGLGFPCNEPRSGCNDTAMEPNGPPQCGCTKHLPHSSASESCNGCVPMPARPSVAMELACSAKPLQASFSVRGLNHYSAALRCGNMLRYADLSKPPTVTYTEAKEGFFYTLAMTGLLGSNQSLERRWVVGNIPAGSLKAGMLDSATTVSPYRPPGHADATTTINLVLLKQVSGLVEFVTFAHTAPIHAWDYEGFLEQYGLNREPIAQNWFAASASGQL